MPSLRQAQRRILPDSNATTHSLQPTDELFLFLNDLAVGSKQWDLADQYSVHQSTVIRIITAWSNFLLALLSSVRTPEEHIHNTPYLQTSRTFLTLIILDCTELRCQCPSSPLLQSEMFSSYKSHCTLKGLIGVAPHGAVTFFLHCVPATSRESGLLTFPKLGMPVMFLLMILYPARL